jgi:hypothetical protein
VCITAVRCTNFLTLDHAASPVRALYSLTHTLARRKTPFDVAATRADALYAVLAETSATTGMALACLLGTLLLAAAQGAHAPLPAYFLPLGGTSALFMALAFLSELLQVRHDMT